MAIFELKQSRQLKGQLQEMEKTLAKSLKAQESLGVTLNSIVQSQQTYSGNAYRTYAAGIKAVDEKYNGTAEWGVVLTGNIIDLRAAFIIGNGVKIVRREGVKPSEAVKELEWARDFFEYNRLDRELTQELAKEAELEGKIALKLFMEKVDDEWHEYEKMVSLRYVSFIDTQYEIITPEDDYMKYEKMIWKDSNGKDQSLKEHEFIYNKFGGRISKPNEAQPKILKCLSQVDDVDKALRDWREINHIFAAPILDVECDDDTAADHAADQLKDFNMKIKKAFIHTGSRAKIMGPDMAGVDSLMKEIETKVKVIAGNTGLPIHFLGYLDLLKNRSTGDNTREMVVAGTSRERQIWQATYMEALEKAMNLYNGDVSAKKSKGSRLDPTKLDVVIPVYTQEQWDHIEKVLLPMYLGGAISIETLLSNVPDLDAEGELEKMASRDETEAEKAQAENESLKDELNFTKLQQQGQSGGQQQTS